MVQDGLWPWMPFLTIAYTQSPPKWDNETASTLSDLVGFHYMIFLTQRCELHLEWYSKMAHFVIIICWSVFRFNQKYVGRKCNSLWLASCITDKLIGGKNNGTCLIQLSHRDLNFVHRRTGGTIFVFFFQNLAYRNMANFVNSNVYMPQYPLKSRRNDYVQLL